MSGSQRDSSDGTSFSNLGKFLVLLYLLFTFSSSIELSPTTNVLVPLSTIQQTLKLVPSTSYLCTLGESTTLIEHSP